MVDERPLTLLRQVREATGQTQAEMAIFFGLTGPNGRNTVARWELAVGNPPAMAHRVRFIAYLGQRLGLAQDRQRFDEVWHCLTTRWVWPAVTDYEWQQYALASLDSLTLSPTPVQSHASCAIAYSQHDSAFAQHLVTHMRAHQLQVWYAPEDLEGGQKLYDQIDRAIQTYDQLLIVLSKQSIRSEWVLTEIRRAWTDEQRRNIRKLFPIRLVDMDTLRTWTCFDVDMGKDLAVEVREYFIPDFTDWQDDANFAATFAKLLRDLRAEDASDGH